MALQEKQTPQVKIGPTMVPGLDPPNPADTLRTGSVPRRTFATVTTTKPFERKEVVNLYRRDEPSPEDYCEPRPGDEKDPGEGKFGPQMTPPKASEVTLQGQPIRGTC